MSPLVRRLIAERLRLGLSQTQVAKRMQVTQSAVSEWETGSTCPRLASLERWARALDLRLELMPGGES